MQVFLSYRRSDVGGYAGRLTDALVRRLGKGRVFHDVSTIAPGQDYTVAIDRALDGCDALLAVVGPGWLAPPPGASAPRLFDDADYVRLELSRALARDVRVVPVLVGRASLPAAGELPADLQPLLTRQAIELHDETWHEDVDGLVRALQDPRASDRRRHALIAGTVVALASATLAWTVLQTERDSGSGVTGQSTATPAPECTRPSGDDWNALSLNEQPSVEVSDDEGSLTFSVAEAHARQDGDQWEVLLRTTMRNASASAKEHQLWRYAFLEVAERPYSPSTCFTSLLDVVPPGNVGDAYIGYRTRCEPVGLIQLVLNGDSRIPVTSDSEPSTC